MMYQLIISLPMTVCLFWCIFFAIRAVRGEDEQRIRLIDVVVGEIFGSIPSLK